MRRLVRVLVQLVFGLLCFVAVTAALIVFDGLNDIGDTADAALVPSPGDSADAGGAAPALKRAVRLYKDGFIKWIILTTDEEGMTTDITRHLGVESSTVYLKNQGVPDTAIIADTGASDTESMARDVAAILQVRDLSTIMIVTDYYRMSRVKLALLHAGLDNISKSHVGYARLGDAWPIAREVVALYDFVFRAYLQPTAEKVKQEAAQAAEKASAEAAKARNGVDKSIDSLPK